LELTDRRWKVSVRRLFIDFETYSELDIKVVGAERYLRHPSARPLCKSFSLDGAPASLWVNDGFHSDVGRVMDYLRGIFIPKGRYITATLPSGIQEALRDPELKVYAHNALFDFRVWNYLCVPLFGWPPLRLEQMEDTMAICQYMSLPASLDKAGEALGAAIRKGDGKKFIRATCSPQPVKEKRVVTGYRKPDLFDERDTQNFVGLFEYCINDTDAMVSDLDALPCKQLPAREKEIWLMTAEINLKGLPVRKEEIDAINTRLDLFQREKKDELLKLTGGKLYSGSQYAAIKKYCDSLGYPIDNCQGDYLAEKVGDPEMPEHIRSVLSIVLVLGKSSTAKYRKIQDHMLPCETHGDYVVRDTLCYHGASTGRWSGRGIQPQNFPGVVSGFPEDDMGFFTLGLPINDPVLKSKLLLRASIIAPEGHCVIAADYSAIENVVLAWIAGDEASLDDFRAGRKQYITMAVAVFGGTYDALKAAIADGDKDALLRYKIGKALVLGCGYGMGAKKFRETASTVFKLDLTEEAAAEYVAYYREHYYKNVECWYGLKNAATRAVISGAPQTFGSITYRTAKFNGHFWLMCVLPNGKKLFYPDPKIEEKYIPGYKNAGKQSTLTHMGLNSVSKKWERMSLIPGRTAENVVQATSREIMAEGMLNVRSRMKGDVELRGTVHDEALGLCPEGRPELLGQMIKHLCDIPWAVGCPIKAAGYIDKRFKKQ
jgi:DNA polymerase